jgi:hypothetical protein
MRRLLRRCVKQWHKRGQDIPWWAKGLLPLIGLLALLWFLIRVLPKPSRAAYPCQRVAFPLASSFVLWLMGLVGAWHFMRRAALAFSKHKRLVGIGSVLVAVLLVWTMLSQTSDRSARAADPLPNQPIGLAQGVHPGRVVWIHDPNATHWEGVGHGHPWEPAHTTQANVDAMVSKAVCALSGCANEDQAWDALFRYFNTQNKRGDRGYEVDEKICIKINLTTTNGGSHMNRQTYTKTSFLDKADTSPQIILAVLRQLVLRAGVNPRDIAVGDTLCDFPKQWWDICQAEFPEVTFFDDLGAQGRVRSTPSTVRQFWSYERDRRAFAPDYIPELYAQADYLINLAVLKGHAAGITLCAKNHYGSYNRRPSANGYYNLHDSIAGANFDPKPAQYRALVDIMGHPHMGAKTLLYLVDGLYGGYRWEGTAHRFNTAPFHHDWPSSILASQDPVAIDSVGLDILWEEWPAVVQVPGVDDYLKEAALAHDPPSGSFYDPDGDGTALGSLGVHERWNNSVDRQYSRNLGLDEGVELLYARIPNILGDINADAHVNDLDLQRLLGNWLWRGAPGQIAEDLNADGQVDFQDLAILCSAWD